MKIISGVISFLMTSSLMMNICSISAFAVKADNGEYIEKTELRLVAENKSLALYVNDISGEIELKDKLKNFIWRSSPENVENDPLATKTVISELMSPLSMTYCEPEKRSDTGICSQSGASVEVNDIRNGAEITYKFNKAGVTVPVRLTLGENYLEVTVDTASIDESREDMFLTELSVMSSFGAAGSDDDGYFVIPDGCGAVINFNNGKTNVKSYTNMVYGRDVTAVPLKMPDNTEQIYFPMYGIVNGNNGLMVVCTDGDANAKLTASVSGVSKSSYNICSFEFTLRSSDTYYMSGESTNALTVFEDGDINTDKISLRYYPVTDTNKKGMDYTDIATAYREYLTDEMNVEKTVTYSPELYIDIYGGIEKKRSFFGIPITMKTSLTTSEQARSIIETLRGIGVSNLVVSYNKWTDDGIKNRIDTSAKASGTIGKDEFYELLKYAKDNHILIYPSVRNTAFRSGNGYSIRSDSSIRISGEYARLHDYNIVNGNADTDSKAMSILTPLEYPELLADLSENFTINGIDNICLSEFSSVLYGDYGSRNISRDKTQKLITEGYEILSSSMNSILADEANAYVLPYVDRISNVPLCSSGYDIFDEDIPFYQIVLHGIKSYSTEPINESSDSRELLLRAIASGSDIHYDMIGENAAILKNTELEGLYYAYYDDWAEQAAQDFLFVENILSDVKDKFITDYRQSGNKIYTEYENGKVIIVDLKRQSVTSDGKEYFLDGYRVNWREET